MTGTKVKRVRTCVGCGQQSDKMALMRVVRTDEGVRFDGTGKMPGRGAYACSAKCLADAFASRKLQRALRCGIERSDMDRVVADMAASSAQAR